MSDYEWDKEKKGWTLAQWQEYWEGLKGEPPKMGVPSKPKNPKPSLSGAETVEPNESM